MRRPFEGMGPKDLVGPVALPASKGPTDAEILAADEPGLTLKELQQRTGLSTIPLTCTRRKKARIRVAAHLIASGRDAERFAKQNIRVMEVLATGAERVQKLQAACDEWLTDPDHPEKYTLEPRTDEVNVIYLVQVEVGCDQHGNPKYQTQKRKRPLSDLLQHVQDPDGDPIVSVKKAEFAHADPRKLAIDTAAELRQTSQLIINAAQKLADQKLLEEWRKAILEEVGKESADCAKRIAKRIQSVTGLLFAAFGGPGRTRR